MVVMLHFYRSDNWVVEFKVSKVRGFLRRPPKWTKSSPSICVSVKSTVKISSIFVAFLENMNFNQQVKRKILYFVDRRDTASLKKGSIGIIKVNLLSLKWSRFFLKFLLFVPYSRHYNPRLVYFKPTFWGTKSFN